MDIEKLKALALAATAGEWRAGYGIGVLGGRAAAAVSWDLTDVRSMPVRNGEEVIAWLACFKPDDEELRGLSADAEYIAAACPATVRELIAEVERLRARFEYIEDHATTSGGGHGFTVSLFVPVDSEDIGCGIDAAIEKEKA